MTMDISRLGIVVESSGINEATEALHGKNGKGGLALAADKVDKRVTSLTASLGKLISVQTSATASAWTQSLSGLNGVLAGLVANANATATALNQMITGMNEMAKATANANKQADQSSRSHSIMMSTFKAMTAAFSVYTAINFAGSIVSQADAWQMMTAKLENATGSLHNAKVAQGQMFDMSQRLQVPLEDSVKLYTRLAPALQKAGKSSDYAKDMVEGISTALKLSGATGGEAASVMLQLSQSFSSGVLNGAEFNAVAENGSVLMRALEKYTGKSTAELKKMGASGKLSMEIVGKAIQEQLPEWREQFDKLPLTFEGGLTRLKNAWTKAVGEMGQDTGFNKELSGALRVIEDIIPAVANGLGAAFISVMQWVDKNKSKLGEIWTQILGIGKDVWNVAGMLGNWLGEILGAGDGFSLVAAALFTVRMLIAGAIDLLKVAGYIIAEIGIDIAELIVAPFTWLLAIVEKVGTALQGLFAKLASGAKAMGMTELATGLQSASDSIGAVTDNVKNFNGNIQASFAKAHEVAGGWVKDLQEGNGELDKLINGTDELSKKSATAPGKMDPKAWNANKDPKSAVDDKGAKAAAAAEKKYKDEMEALNAKFKEQIELQKRLATDGLDSDKIGPAAKKRIELEEHLLRLSKDRGASNIEITRTQNLLNQARENEKLEVRNEHTLETLKAEKALQDQQNTKLKSLQEEAAAMERKVATYGMAKGELEKLEEVETRKKVAELEGLPEITAAQEKLLATYKAQLVAREQISAAAATLGGLQVEAEFNKLMDPKRAEKFGDALASGMGKGVKAIGAMVNAFDKYIARMSVVKKAEDLIAKEDDPYKKAKMVKEASELEAESRIRSYAEMSGAAKSYFEEGSRGYQILGAAEKTFRAFEVAMNVQSFAQKSGMLEMFDTLWFASERAKYEESAASVGPHLALEETKQGANAVTALTGALAAPFPANLSAYATVAAMLAALGVAVGGIGGSGPKIDPGNTGAGTTFGDSSAASASLQKSLDKLATVDTITMTYSAQMASSLRNIEFGIGGLSNMIVRSGGLEGAKAGIRTGDTTRDVDRMATTGTLGQIAGALVAGPIGSVIGGIAAVALSKVPVLGTAINTLSKFAYNQKTTITGNGIQQNRAQTLGEILSSGFDAGYYADVQTKKKTFGFTTSNKTHRNAIDDGGELDNQFGLILSGFYDTIKAAAGPLKYNLSTIQSALDNYIVNIGEIDLKNLNGQQIQEKLMAVFGAEADKMAEKAVPGLKDFQKVGEGYFETLTRVSTGVEQAQVALEKLGIKVIDFSKIGNKQGDVGLEVIRASLEASETEITQRSFKVFGKIFKYQTITMSGIGKIVDGFQGSAEDLVALYTQLIAVRSKMESVGLGTNLTKELITAAGGLSELSDALESFSKGFFSDSERNSSKLLALRKEFSKLGAEMPTTRDGFRELVERLNASGLEGQKAAVKVMLLSESFAELADSADSVVAKAREDLTSAYEREADALKETKSKFEDFAKSLLGFRDELLTGDLSPLTATEKYKVQLDKFNAVSSAALAGDESAIADFQSVASDFLKFSRDVFASGANYTADFNRVLDLTSSLAGVSTNKASVADESLAALNAQVEGLITVNESVLTVAQAIDNLRAAMGLGIVASTQVDGSHANGLSYVPFDGYVAELHKGEAVLTASENKAYQMDYSQYGRKSDDSLVNEIKALREEVSTLKGVVREQTGQLIAANYDAQERNADAVVAGTKDAASTMTYSERSKVTLA